MRKFAWKGICGYFPNSYQSFLERRLQFFLFLAVFSIAIVFYLLP